MQETFWTFKTNRFTVEAIAREDYDLDLSWDDTGEVAERLESGDLIAFAVQMRVSLDGQEIASDYLGGCVYDSLDDFRTGGGYFPDMVSEACGLARAELKRRAENPPYMRCAA